MASLIFKEKKGMNFSCTAPASTAVCTSIDRRSIIQPSSSRYLDRYTPHLRDQLRSKAASSASQSLVLPPPPTTSTLKKKTIKHKQKSANIARKSLDILTVSAEKISPPVSSRYLLNSERFSDVYAESESVPTPEPPPLLIMGLPSVSAEISEEIVKNIATTDSKSPPTHVDKPKDQVVELRVSLHCKGCQAKVKKHLAKMEGVTSFNIDFATKKVTVIGDVTPLGVLNSISKVKNAQFWPSPPSLSSHKFSSHDLISY